MPTTPAYSSQDVCALTGATYRQLDYWAKTGLLCPSISDPRGQGNPRRWSHRDIEAVIVIRHLRDAGFSRAHGDQLALDLAGVLAHVYARGLHGVVTVAPAVLLDLDVIRRMHFAAEEAS